jgi:hypothetical protein
MSEVETGRKSAPSNLTGASGLRLSGPQVKAEPGYPAPQEVAVGLPAAAEMAHPLVVGPEEVEPCVPGLQRGRVYCTPFPAPM